jgi:uncharacterized protein (TIGR02246 family)
MTMRSYLHAASLIILALVVGECHAAADAPAPAEDVAAIKALFGTHMAALSAGDAAGVTALFADNGVMVPPDRGAMTGKEAIRWGLRQAFGLFSAKITGESLEAEVAGGWAFARRIYTMTLTAKTGGEQMEVVANWLDILKRQPDGSWKIHVETVNSDRSLPVINP